MTVEQSAETQIAPSSASGPAVAGAVRRWLFPATQWACVLLTLYLGLRAYHLIDGIGEQVRIDEASIYYGIGLLLMLYFAWDGKFPAVATWPQRAVAYVRAHPLELAAIAGICLAGAFIRLWRYGDLPPGNFIVLEEHIHSGIAWDILQGARPYQYPSVRYGGALAQEIFGPSTWGVRGHLVISGVLSVPVFYLMMRECVDRPYALFATAMFASLRVLGDTMAQYQSPMLEQLLMVWMALRGLRTGVLLWFVPAAALGVILSYEYETSKAVPLFFGAFLVWIAIRRLAWPIPHGVGDVWRRVRTHAPAAIRTAVIVTVIFVVGFGPIVAQSHHGLNVYFASLDRQRADRDARGTPGLLAPNWDQQLENSIDVFSPWRRAGYTSITPVETRGAIDSLTSVLLWASVIAGAVFFWRGYRSLFVGWFVGGMIISSMLLSVWAPWKVIGWLPPAVALTGFLAEDAGWLLRRYWKPGLRLLPAALALIVAAVFVLNLRTLNANANDERVLREYANTPSQQYAICDRLRDRPDGNYAYVSQRVRSSWGWSRPPTGDKMAEAISWGDFRFVCMGLRGASAASLSEIWPIDVSREGPLSLVQSGEPEEIRRLVEELATVLPELGAPAVRDAAPANVFELLLYDTTRDQLNARQGLVHEWLDESGNVIQEGVARGAPEFDLGQPPTGASTYRLRGLVYLADDAETTLVLDGAPPETTVSIDQDALPGLITNSPLAAMRGWHLVDIEGEAREGIRFSLAWQRDGLERRVGLSETFALPAVEQLWRHERTYALPDGSEFTALRYDVNPHYAAFDGLRVAPDEALPFGTRVLSERWSGDFTVSEGGTYRLFLSAFRQRVGLLIDGANAFPGDADPVDQASVDIELAAGDHSIEITFEPAAEDVTNVGGVLGVSFTQTGEEVRFPVRPY